MAEFSPLSGKIFITNSYKGSPAIVYSKQQRSRRLRCCYSARNRPAGKQQKPPDHPAASSFIRDYSSIKRLAVVPLLLREILLLE